MYKYYFKFISPQDLLYIVSKIKNFNTLNCDLTSININFNTMLKVNFSKNYSKIFK